LGSWFVAIILFLDKNFFEMGVFCSNRIFLFRISIIWNTSRKNPKHKTLFKIQNFFIKLFAHSSCKNILTTYILLKKNLEGLFWQSLVEETGVVGRPSDFVVGCMKMRFNSLFFTWLTYRDQTVHIFQNNSQDWENSSPIARAWNLQHLIMSPSSGKNILD
jgi:hypothetical protein